MWRMNPKTDQSLADINRLSLPKDKTIGILGGGQLGRMLAMAAGRLGFHTLVLDPTEQCPAAQFADHQIVAQYDDHDALTALAKSCRVVTYEFENIPVASARAVESICALAPNSKALETSQDRLVEKNFINSAGLQTAGFQPVSTTQQLHEAINQLSLPLILKTRRLGYDGKGQIVLKGENLLESEGEISAMLEAECIVEKLVDFKCEISIIAARGNEGKTVCYDPARNTHVRGMLSRSQVPCGLSEHIIEEAKRQAIKLLEKLDYIGVIGVEFFVTASDELLINEFAPRVHNSGHWTEAACLISQFEQHIRAIVGLALGGAWRHSDCVMENLVGEDIRKIAELVGWSDTLVHDYGKQEIRAGRKMGHMTTISAKQ